MPVPDFQSLMLPVLKAFSDGNAAHVAEVCDRVAKAEGLTPDDLAEMTRGGTQTRLKDRVTWSITYFLHAGLVERTRRSIYRITMEGSRLLSRNIDRIDTNLLLEFPAFFEWKNGTHRDRVNQTTVAKKVKTNEPKETPEETLCRAAEKLRSILEFEVLARVRNAESAFLEHVIIDLLHAMGYADGNTSKGRKDFLSDERGISGTIRGDVLGLNKIYLQAKSCAESNAVGESELRNFAGAIDAAGTTNGVFVTTASFTQDAKGYAARSPKRIILIDGEELARLMVLHGIGVRTRIRYDLKRIDKDYFDQESR